MEHESYREHLQGLSDCELLERCITEKRIARFYDRTRPSALLELCWAECCRREKKEIFYEALRTIREEIREEQAFNKRATEELT